MDESNDLITISEAAEFFPQRNGKLVHLKTLHRRIRQGSRGVRLRAVCDGGQWFTTRAWVADFMEASTAIAARPNCPVLFSRPAADADAAIAELRDRWGL